MAHECCSCGSDCYCHGDIDDTVVSKTPDNCSNCGCDTLWAGDEFDDDDDEEEVPIGYYCTTCEHDQGRRNGGICDNCGMAIIDEYY